MRYLTVELNYEVPLTKEQEDILVSKWQGVRDSTKADIEKRVKKLKGGRSIVGIVWNTGKAQLDAIASTYAS